jgi:serine protease Do
VEALLIALLLLTWIFTGSVPAEAQNVGDVYRKVKSTVVVIKAQGRDVNASGFTSFTETGSGVIISADGKVMTAAHVVHAMDEISVEVLGGESVKAKVVASEPAADLSLLQMERMPKGAMVSKLADSNTVRVGDRVIIVGAPYGLAHSLTSGLISARWAPNTVYRAMPLAEFFQTDAVINTGNSGGPMFSMAGEVIGIVSHNISKSGGSEGLGFVVTGNTARQLLLEKRSFWSGLEGQILTDRQADVLNLPPQKLGYIVKTVAKGSPAEVAGIKGGATTATIDGESLVVGGDIILSVEGIEITKNNLTGVRDALSKLRSGETFKATVLRAGRVVELNGRIP